MDIKDMDLMSYVTEFKSPLSYMDLSPLMGKPQKERVWWVLQEIGRISNLECHEYLGIRHAPSVIRDLRKKLEEENSDYAIINERKTGCDRFGNPTWWDDYVLIKEGTQRNLFGGAA